MNQPINVQTTIAKNRGSEKDLEKLVQTTKELFSYTNYVKR